MITMEDIIEIYQNRENRLDDWLEEKSEKKTILQFKKDMKKWGKEISDAQNFAKEHDPNFPKDSLGTAYTFMNTSSAIYANYVVATQYIKKLEITLKKIHSKNS